MTSNNHNLYLFNNISDLDCRNNFNHIQNSIHPFKPDFNYLNTLDNKIKYTSSLNKEILSNSLFYNYNYIKDHGQFENQIDLSKNEEKTLQEKQLPPQNYKKNNLFIIQDSLSILNNSKNNSNSEKKYGRKKKRDNSKEEAKHSKFTDDNIRRKCKHLVLDSVMKFINLKIEIVYNGNIGNNIFKKKLLTLNSNQTTDASINFNQKFLTKKLREIFSDSISTRFTNFPPQHNKLLIQRLLNEEDENKRDYFKKLFDITFLQCVKHFIGSDYIVELDGMDCFSEVKKQFNEKDYTEVLEFYFNNFEEIIMKKKSRVRSKKTIKEKK